MVGRNELLWMIEDVCACITITFLGVDGWNMMEPCRVCHGLPICLCTILFFARNMQTFASKTMRFSYFLFFPNKGHMPIEVGNVFAEFHGTMVSLRCVTLETKQQVTYSSKPAKKKWNEQSNGRHRATGNGTLKIRSASERSKLIITISDFGVIFTVQLIQPEMLNLF